MPSDFQLSADLGIAIKNGQYATVDGDAFTRQHIVLAVLDILARQDIVRLTDETVAELRSAIRRRLEAHTQVGAVESITIDRDAPPRVLRGEIVTEAVTVPLDERL